MAEEQAAPTLEQKSGVAASVSVSTEKPAAEEKKETPKFAGKFNSVEDLEKSYKELETKLGSASPTGKTPEQAPSTPTEAKKQVEAAGLDFNALAAEFSEKGSLSEASLKALETQGISRSTAEQYIRGQQAIAREITAEIAKIAGGQDQFDAMREWAKADATEEAGAFDRALATQDPAMIRLATRGLVEAYRTQVGQDPKLVRGGESVGTAGAEAFASTAEMVKAMSDPRYGKDTAYTAKVVKRLEVSSVFGL